MTSNSTRPLIGPVANSQTPRPLPNTTPQHQHDPNGTWPPCYSVSGTGRSPPTDGTSPRYATTAPKCPNSPPSPHEENTNPHTPVGPPPLAARRLAYPPLLMQDRTAVLPSSREEPPPPRHAVQSKNPVRVGPITPPPKSTARAAGRMSTRGMSKLDSVKPPSYNLSKVVKSKTRTAALPSSVPGPAPVIRPCAVKLPRLPFLSAVAARQPQRAPATPRHA